MAPAAAQENLDQGKTPAQLYASDCAICHKSPRGLAKGAGRSGLNNFLRKHYTASRESAAAIGAYLQSVDRGAPAPRRERETKHKAKLSGPRLPPHKPTETKSSQAKPSESGAKASASEREEAKTAAPKASEAKPVEHSPAVSRPAEAKADAPKANSAPPAKDDKPEKSD